MLLYYIYTALHIFLRNLVYLFFRQKETVPGNLAALSLEPDVQQRNVRKVEVNAKITFSIWVMEMFSMALLFAVGVIMNMKELASVINLLIYYIIIPLTFLMNTPDRKDRLIDIGFLSMIRLLVESHFRLAVQNNQEVSMDIERVQHTTRTKMRHKVSPKNTASASQRPLSQMKESKTKTKEYKSHLTCQRREINTVSRAVDMTVEDIETEC